MWLKEILENPNGGQLLSAYMLLIAAISLALLIVGNVAFKLFRGEEVEFNRDGIVLLVMLATAIPALLKFVRSHHAR